MRAWHGWPVPWDGQPLAVLYAGHRLAEQSVEIELELGKLHSTEANFACPVPQRLAMLGDPTQVAVISVAADDRLEVWGIVSGVVSSASSDMK